MADVVKLNLLLMGESGHGESATANTLLNRRVFQTSANFTSDIKDINYSSAWCGNYMLTVVDGLFLTWTDKNKVKNMEAAAKDMDKALAMCYGGFDAILFVVKFGNRFATMDNSALAALKQMFGVGYLDHVIVVVTGEDLYQDAIEEEGCDLNFDEWCSEQDGEFRQLYDDCEGRVVLFNNREKDETKKQAMTEEILKLAKSLQMNGGRYTSECYNNAEFKREKLFLEMKAPQLIADFQKKILHLAADNKNLTNDFIRRNQNRKRVQDLRREIEYHDRDYGVLTDLLVEVQRLENDLELKLKSLNQIGEVITRRTLTPLGMLGTACSLVGDVLTFTEQSMVQGVSTVMSHAMEKNLSKESKTGKCQFTCHYCQSSVGK